MMLFLYFFLYIMYTYIQYEMDTGKSCRCITEHNNNIMQIGCNDIHLCPFLLLHHPTESLFPCGWGGGVAESVTYVAFFGTAGDDTVQPAVRDGQRLHTVYDDTATIIEYTLYCCTV